jgi:hypothetical protein
MGYWRRFADVAGTHASILQRIIGHLPEGGSNALRQVNRAMRAGVNRTVTTAEVTLNGARVNTELATVFPDANALRISTHSNDPVSGVDVCMFLECVLATSPTLVEQLQSLVLSIEAVVVDEEVSSAISGFLSRCGHSVWKRILNSSLLCKSIQRGCKAWSMSMMP